MELSKKKALKLQCSVQNYEWGCKGEQSTVAKLYALQSKSPIEPDKPYAELWMGTHESGPSSVLLDEDNETASASGDKANGFGAHHAGNHASRRYINKIGYTRFSCNCSPQPQRSLLLSDWLLKNPEALGRKVLLRWGVNLPFLFKVLSVQKALSIQAHPDKELAKSLHRRQPQIYKDSNHKPEMALAITHFEALCGFLSAQELKIVVESVPELQYVLGTSLSYDLMNVSISCEKTTKLTLKAAFSAIINANKDLITKSLSQLILRLKSSQQERSLTQRELLILRLAEQYPNDVGIFSALFLNYIRLEPGQALYLSANEPHAYLLGECIECMAASDNVVRAGLTPKYIDTKTLCDMLTYNQGMPEILSGINLNAYTKRYSPPFDEFEMESCMLPIGQRMRLSSIEGPSILIVLGGSGTLHERDGNAQSLQFGDTVFLSAGTEYDVITNPASKGNLQFYRAGVNSRVLLMD